MFILLVEDHEDTSRAMATLLRFAGHEVVVASDAAQALVAVDQQREGERQFDTAVVDLGLPDMTGIDLMKKLRARRPIKGIALTGSTAPADIQSCIAAGFSLHLPKPVTIEELEQALQKL